MKNNENINFKDWYESLPANKQTPTRDLIISRCEYSWTKFYRLLKGYYRPTELEKKAIEKIAKCKLNYPTTLPKMA